MQIVKSDEIQSVILVGVDKDLNEFIMPSGSVNLSLSSEDAGVLIDNGDGTYDFDPKKVGVYNLSAESNGLVGSLDFQVEHGAAFQIGIKLAKKEAPKPDPQPEQPQE